MISMAVALALSVAVGSVDAAPSPPTPAGTGAGFVATTPWPVVPPCARPQTVTVGDAVAGDLSWSKGGAGISLAAAHVGQSAPIEPELRHVHLERLTGADPGAVRQGGRVVEIACGGGATVAWGPCVGDRCAVAVRYPGSRIPNAWRLRPWLRPRPPRRGEAETAGAPSDSRFLERIAHRPSDDVGAGRQAAKLARDLAGDLLDVLRLACPRDRCSAPLRAAEQSDEAFLLAGEATRATVRQQAAVPGGGSSWRWTTTGSGASVDVSCVGHDGDRDVHCTVAIPVAEGLTVAYRAETGWTREGDDLVLGAPGRLDGEAPLGRVRFARSDGGRVWVEITGDALSVRPEARPTH